MSKRILYFGQEDIDNIMDFFLHLKERLESMRKCGIEKEEDRLGLRQWWSNSEDKFLSYKLIKLSIKSEETGLVIDNNLYENVLLLQIKFFDCDMRKLPELIELLSIVDKEIKVSCRRVKNEFENVTILEKISSDYKIDLKLIIRYNREDMLNFRKMLHIESVKKYGYLAHGA